MKLGTAGYWLSMAGFSVEPVGEGSPRSIVLDVPKGNLLTTKTLHALLIGDLEGARHD